jgi:hypothetical protein
MDDALVVRGFEGFGDLTRDGQRFVDRKGPSPESRAPSRDQIGERRPFDQLHHERLEPVGLFEPVDGGDVGMIQRGEDFGFALEPREALGIASDRFGQTLIATWRFSFVSVARYTSPMPPAPIWAVTSYEPRRVPGVRATRVEPA